LIVKDQQRLLVIGAGGFLGAHVLQAAKSTGNYDVLLADRSASKEDGIEELDIANAASVEDAFRRTRPDQVVLLAAISDIDKCESAPELAFAVNAQGAENVANACARHNAKLLFTSTAAVFDGLQHGYCEEDKPTPLSVYGKTKAWAEEAVGKLVPSAITLRLALVLGFAGKSGTNAMLDNIVARWKSGNPVTFPTYELRNPIDAATLASVMLRMIGDPNPALRGLYHVGASDSISRYELGLRLASRLGVSPDLVRAQDNAIPGRAPRGADHFLLTSKIRNDFNIDFETSERVIERCFA
jgi:dTDP-4-dehydrorhamnose reductase